MYQILAYITFLWHSKNEHAVHSPFVFDLITICFYDKKKHSFYELFHNYRKVLLNNQQTITVTDFGAGSRTFKSNTRKIAAIAKHAGVSKKNGELLSRLTNYFKPENILEIGTSLGIGSVALCSGQPSAMITTLEGCPNTAAVAMENFKKLSLNNINIDIGEFNQTLAPLTTKKFDMIYFDGNHNYEATIAYFESLLQTAHNETVFILDDIHWSKGMEAAWKTIKAHPKVTITIDTFYHGFVFFRKEHKEKEHFIIRV